MRTLGQLLMCVLLAVPSTRAAFAPWDLDADNAAALALKLEHHVALQSGKLAVYFQVPAAQLRAVADLPLMRELTRTIGLDALLRHHAAPLSVRACRQRV